MVQQLPKADSEEPHCVATPAAARPATFSVARALLGSGGARLAVLPVSGLCSLVNAKLITSAVGVDQFGIVMLIATLSQVLAFADLGAGAAVATARARVDGSPVHTEHFRRTVLTALRTVLCTAGALGLAAVVIGLFGGWPSMLGIGTSGVGPMANVAVVIALLAFSANLPFTLGEAVLRGSGEQRDAVLLNGFAAPAALVITMVFYAADAPPLAYALSIPFGSLLASMCCAGRAWMATRQVLRGLSRQVFPVRRFPGTAIAATAAPMFVTMVGLPIALQSDRLIIAHRLAPASLSDYSYASQLYSPLYSVVFTAAFALWPVFASAASSPRGNIRRSWLTALAILGPAGLVLAVGFLLLARVVIDWTSGGSASPGWTLLLAFAALLLVQAAHVATGITLISPRQLRFQAVCVVALVVTNLPLSWVLTPSLGPAGPVLASVVTVVVCQLLPGIAVALRATSTSSEGRLRHPSPRVNAWARGHPAGPQADDQNRRSKL